MVTALIPGFLKKKARPIAIDDTSTVVIDPKNTNTIPGEDKFTLSSNRSRRSDILIDSTADYGSRTNLIAKAERMSAQGYDIGDLAISGTRIHVNDFEFLPITQGGPKRVKNDHGIKGTYTPVVIGGEHFYLTTLSVIDPNVRHNDTAESKPVLVNNIGDTNIQGYLTLDINPEIIHDLTEHRHGTAQHQTERKVPLAKLFNIGTRNTRVDNLGSDPNTGKLINGQTSHFTPIAKVMGNRHIGAPLVIEYQGSNLVIGTYTGRSEDGAKLGNWLSN